MSTETMDVHIDCFVTGAFAVVLRVARILGIAPLRFVKKKTGWRISPSLGWAIYGCILLTIITVITAGNIIIELHTDQEKTTHMQSKSNSVVWVISMIIIIVIATTAVVRALGQMRCMIACVNKVQKINYDLNIHHWPDNSERKKTILFVVWMIVSLALPCFDHVLVTIKIYRIGANRISMIYSFYYILFWMLVIYEMVFILMTLHVMYSFRAINDTLRTLMYDLSITEFQNLPFIISFNNRQFKANKKQRFFNNKVNYLTDSGKIVSDGSRKTRSNHETVHCLSLVYVHACDVVREIERYNGPCLLMMLGNYLWLLVVSPFNFINNILDRDTLQNNMAMYISLVLVQLFWCIFHFVNLVMATEPCHLTQTEIEITRELVSRLMRCTHSMYDPLAVELEMFSRQLILNKATYSPLKVTTMSRSLVAAIIGSITTYLVIVVQL